MTLMSSEVLEGGAVWLRYRIENRLIRSRRAARKGGPS